MREYKHTILYVTLPSGALAWQYAIEDVTVPTWPRLLRCETYDTRAEATEGAYAALAELHVRDLLSPYRTDR